jgi:hypothetical protein
MTAHPHAARTFVSITDAHRRCLGHAVYRGKMGWEAYDRNDQSIGLFKSPAEAAEALTKAVNP